MPDNFDGFLKIAGIESESKDPAHVGWIDVEAFTYSARLDYTVGKEAKLVPSASHPGEFTFTGGVHKGSPNIFKYCVTGQEIPQIEFHACKAAGMWDDGKKEYSGHFLYLEAVLTDCLITDVSVGAGGGPLPVETIKVAYRQVQMAYREQDASGYKVKGGKVTMIFDRAKNRLAEA